MSGKIVNERTTRRKWESSGRPIRSLDTLIACVDLCGGVWNTRTGSVGGRYENSSWVRSWQLSHVLNLVEAGVLQWPVRADRGTRGGTKRGTEGKTAGTVRRMVREEPRQGSCQAAGTPRGSRRRNQREGAGATEEAPAQD